MPEIKKTVFRLLGIFDAVRMINEKYKQPKIKMTPIVKLALLVLRIYLFFFLFLLLFKFISMAINQ